MLDRLRAIEKCTPKGPCPTNRPATEVASLLEAPRHVIVSARAQSAAELTRWLLERYRIPYHEKPHTLLLYGAEAPQVVSADATWRGPRAILEGLDATLRDSERPLAATARGGGSGPALASNILDGLALAVDRVVCFHLAPHRRAFYPLAVDGASMWERGVAWAFYPLWRRRLQRSLRTDPESLALAEARIREAFDLVEAELRRAGTRYLGGSEPGPLDVIFSALAAPLVLPDGHGVRLPRLEQLPSLLASLVGEMRGRQAGQLVLDTYAAARPVPQPALPARSYKRSLRQRLVTPRVQQLGARLAVFLGPVLKIRKIVVVSRWPEVKAALEYDLDFGIAPVNRPHIEAIDGPFLLSLDRGQQLARERPRLYDAVSRIDLEAVRRGIAAEAERLLDGAAERGHIDAGDGYARLVAARTAVRLFGIAGPTEGDLKRVCRAMFQHAFLNIGDDAAVADRALHAAAELRAWILEEIARRRTSGVAGDDVLGHLMTTRSSDGILLDDDAVRRNLAGLLVGAIDTTSVAVLGIIAALTSDRRLLARVEADLGNRERMVVWCYEALRRRPQTPLVIRRAVRNVTVGRKAVPSGALLAAFTQAAMFDPAVFPHPGRLDPSRCPRDYMHFGGGLHPCAGRDINAVQLPELVGRLVARGIHRAGSVRFDGPFLDQLVVYFGRPRP